MEIVNDPSCNPKQFRHSYLRSTLVLILVTLMVRYTHTHTHSEKIKDKLQTLIMQEWAPISKAASQKLIDRRPGGIGEEKKEGPTLQILTL